MEKAKSSIFYSIILFTQGFYDFGYWEKKAFP